MTDATLCRMQARTAARRQQSDAPTTSGIMLDVCRLQERVETPIEEWLRHGPAGSAARPVAARMAPSGNRLPLYCVVPLRYRNSRFSRLLIALHVLSNPWPASQ